MKNIIPGTEHIHRSRELAQELLDFIEREPAMKWLIDRVEPTDDFCSCIELYRMYLSQFGHVALATRFHKCCSGGSCSQNPEDTVAEQGIVAALCYDDETSHRWFINNGCVFDVGPSLDIEKIISILKLNTHEVAEATELYGKKIAPHINLSRETKDLHDSVERGQELLDFIDREPVMKWLLDGSEQGNVSGLLLNVRGQDHLHHNGKEWVVKSFAIGPTLDIEKVISILNLSAHEVAQATLYGTEIKTEEGTAKPVCDVCGKEKTSGRAKSMHGGIEAQEPKE